MTRSSSPDRRRCRFLTSCGVNEPSRSRGTAICTGPASVNSSLDRYRSGSSRRRCRLDGGGRSRDGPPAPIPRPSSSAATAAPSPVSRRPPTRGRSLSCCTSCSSSASAGVGETTLSTVVSPITSVSPTSRFSGVTPLTAASRRPLWLVPIAWLGQGSPGRSEASQTAGNVQEGLYSGS